MKGSRRKQCSMCGSFARNSAPESGRCDVCYYKQHLFNLLAILLRKEWRYTDEHDVDKAVEDAMKIASDKDCHFELSDHCQFMLSNQMTLDGVPIYGVRESL